MTSANPDCQRTLERLRERLDWLKREGKYLPDSRSYRSSAHTDVTITWRAAGWRPLQREEVAT